MIIQTKRKIAIILLFAILITLLIYVSSTKSEESGKPLDTVSLNNGWQYRIAEFPISSNRQPSFINDNNSYWESFDQDFKVKNLQKTNNFWVRIKLPQTPYTEPSALLTSYDRINGVYIDDKMLFDGTKNSLLETQNEPWVIVHLPTEFQGRYLYLQVYSPNFSGQIGYLNESKLGSKTDISVHKSSIVLETVKKETIFWVVSCLFIFLGLFMQITFSNKKSEQKSFFYIGFSTICVGLWTISLCKTSLSFFENIDILYYLALSSTWLSPIGFYSFVEHSYAGKNKNIYHRFTQIYIFCAITSMLLDFFNIISTSITIYVFLLLVIIFLIIAIVTFIFRIKNRNAFQSKFLTTGLIIISIFGIYDLIFEISPKAIWPSQINGWGMFVFLIFVLYAVGRQFIDAYLSLDTYSKEIENKIDSLIENKKLLDEAIEFDKLKSEFLANISHELRTPLNIILGSLQLFNTYLKDDLLQKNRNSVIKHVKSMQQNCYRLIRLVNNLIDSTKIDSGYLELTKRNCDIISLIEEITLSTSEYVKSKGISLCFDTDVEEKIIACDPDKIERILLNLLSNSIKFSKPGDSIMVTINSVEDNVVISVEDTGIGIPKDKLNIIFERFRQVDKSLTRNYEGSGIGLSLVKSLINMHNGQISVQSDYGKGSKFIVKLPDAKLDSVEDNISHEDNLKQRLVEKINIEFSDIYT